MKTIGKSIHIVRTLRGLSQRELARASGVDDSYISMIETDKRSPNWSTVKSVAKGLGVSVTLLTMLSESDDPTLKPFMPLLYSTLWETTGRVSENAMD